MAYSILTRLSGLAGMVGGVIYAVSASIVGRRGVGTLRWSLLLFLLGMMAVIAALHFLQRERERYGNWAALASVAALVGVALTVGGYILVDFVVSLEGLGTLLFLVGALLGTMGILGVAIVTLQTEVLPRWGGAASASSSISFSSPSEVGLWQCLGSWWALLCS